MQFLIIIILFFYLNNESCCETIKEKKEFIKQKNNIQKIEVGISYLCNTNLQAGEKCFQDDKELFVVDNILLRELVRDKKDLTNLYTSKVSDLSFLFFKDKEFNEDVSGWDVSNVINMSYMFYGAESFNQDINDWDVSNVKNMAYMFKGAKFFDNLIVWNLKNVKDKRGMFDKKKKEETLTLEGDNFFVSLGTYKGNNRR